MTVRSLPLLLLAAWSGSASAGALLWNGISAGSTPHEVGSLLLVDELGHFHSFDRTFRIAQFYVHPDEPVRVAVLFGQRDGLVNEVDLIDGTQPARAEEALDLHFGRPRSTRLETRQPDPGGVRVTTWQAGAVRVVMEQPVNRPSYNLRFRDITAGS